MLSAGRTTAASGPLRHRVAPVANLPLVWCLPLGRAAAQKPSVPDSEARTHVGQTVTVEGRVAAVHVARSGTIFLNFGRPYPAKTFTAVIFRSAAVRFPDPRQWEGRRVRVTGVRLYHDHPEIVLTAATQLQPAP